MRPTFFAPERIERSGGRYMPYRPFETLADAQKWVIGASEMPSTGSDVPFVIVHNGQVVGSTRFMDIRAKVCGVEIGWTWIAPEWQRTAVNTECKIPILLREAFETAGALCSIENRLPQPPVSNGDSAIGSRP